ncbi:cytochrome C [Burkholderia vietnamiensis]|nr:cytochrome C [Burkholderia vietnamiensis]
MTGDDARTSAAPNAPAGARANCVATTAGAWQAFATIAGVPPDAFGGTQLLADRRGWLRARALPGSAGWSADDLLCRAQTNARPSDAAANADPLTALLVRVDSEPVQDVQAGLPH